MKLVILCLLLFAPAIAIADPAPLEVTAKVIELPKKIILCGRIAYHSVVRYQVISVERGKLTDKEILVVELCPELRKLGETRKLRRPVTKNDSFADEFEARTGPRWFAEEPPVPSAPLQVTARIVEMPKKMIICGVIAYRAVVRYELISVERGKLTTKEILVVELCPETLKVGQTRKLGLRPATKNDSFNDEFTTHTGQRWVHSES